MAIAADVDTGGGALQLESIPVVDLRLFSQSEIYALSLCSSSAYDPDRCDDVVIPKIDRSVFNESAGSRKQTYSRLRLAPPTSFSAAGRRRAPHLRRTVVTTGTKTPDLGNGENAQMLALFKKLFASNVNLEDSFPVEIDQANPLPTLALPAVSEGSRGNKRKYDQIVVHVNDNVDGISSLNEDVVRENLDGKDKGFVNNDGVAVDLITLGLIEHPYLEEIGRMTEGLSTVEELVGFLGGFKGRWDSSRKKRRTVDASVFGSALPTGWKLLIAIQKDKKDGRAWLCCTRYISPSGQQFMSCKEAASYLLNLTGAQDTHPSTSLQHNETISDGLTSLRITDIDTEVDMKEHPSSDTPLPAFASTVSNQEIHVTSNAQICSDEGPDEILQCDKCNITFCKKEESLHYRSSLHKRNENKNAAPITWIKGNKDLNDENTQVINSGTEGFVSIKNPEQFGEHTVGEIQFGTAPVIPSSSEKEIVHVKDDSEAVGFEGNKVNPLANDQTQDGVEQEIHFTVDCGDPANSFHMREINPVKSDSEAGGFEGIKVNPLANSQTQVGVEQEIPFTVDCGDPANSFHMREINRVKSDSEAVGFEGNKIDPLANSQTQGGIEQEIHFTVDSGDMLDQGMDPNVPRGDNELSSGQDFMFDFGEMNAQSAADENMFEGCFDVVPNPNVGTFDLVSEKAEEGLFKASKGTNSCTYILGPGRSELEENSFMGEQGSNSLSEGDSKKLSHDPMFEQELWLGTDDLMANTDDNNDGTSVCVWCRNPFFQDHVKAQTGAIGSLCPSCSTR